MILFKTCSVLYPEIYCTSVIIMIESSSWISICTHCAGVRALPCSPERSPALSEEAASLGLTPPSQWQLYTLHSLPGERGVDVIALCSVYRHILHGSEILTYMYTSNSVLNHTRPEDASV